MREVFSDPLNSPYRSFYETRWGRPWPGFGDLPWNGDPDWSRIMYETMADWADMITRQLEQS